MEDDDRSPWSLPDDTPSHESWCPQAGSLGLPQEHSDWAFGDPLQATPEPYSRQDVFQLPDEPGQFPVDPYQLQVSPEGLYDWQPGTTPDPSCPQHGFQPYPGFAGYPGYQDSQGYQTALGTPLYDQQQDSDLFSDSQTAFAASDNNLCSLGSDLCRNLEHGFPSGPPIEDDEDDDHPPGSQSIE